MPAAGETNQADIRYLVLQGDARQMNVIPDRSVHLALTVPPEWPAPAGAGATAGFTRGLDYSGYLAKLSAVLGEVFRVLVPGGRLVCLTTDIWLSRHRHGHHQIIPFTADCSALCRRIGFDYLVPIIWYRRQRRRRVPAFLGNPYDPNGGFPIDATVIQMQRKPGGFRKPTRRQRQLSRIDRVSYKRWFQQVWHVEPESDSEAAEALTLQIAERLIRMFSYWGDTVLDPFCGSGTSLVAALRCERSGLGIEPDSDACRIAVNRVHEASNPLFNQVGLDCRPLSGIDPEEFKRFSHDRRLSRAGGGDSDTD